MVERPALGDLFGMTLLLMEAEDVLRGEESVAKRAHKAEFEVGVDFTSVDMMFVHQMILDQVTMAVSLENGNMGE